MSIGQRYSVMVKLNQNHANYYLRYASYPYGDMQQVIEGRAILSYQVSQNTPKLALTMLLTCRRPTAPT